MSVKIRIKEPVRFSLFAGGALLLAVFMSFTAAAIFALGVLIGSYSHELKR